MLRYAECNTGNGIAVLSVCLSISQWYRAKTVKHIVKLLSQPVSLIFVLCTELNAVMKF